MKCKRRRDKNEGKLEEGEKPKLMPTKWEINWNCTSYLEVVCNIVLPSFSPFLISPIFYFSSLVIRLTD